MKYVVSRYVDCRVDVVVEAGSFAEAFAKADETDYDMNDVTVIGEELLDGTREDGAFAKYDIRPYPDEK